MTLIKFKLLFVSVLLLASSVTVFADLGQKEARKLISNYGGMSLPKDAIHINRINQIDSDHAEVNAQVELVLRLNQTSDGRWHIAEIRTGPSSWESLDVIARTLNIQLPRDSCYSSDRPRPKKVDVSPATTRCLTATLFGIPAPYDAVRVKEVSSFSLPFGTQGSGIAVVLTEVSFRCGRNGKSWQITGFKSGDRDWFDFTPVSAGMDNLKRNIATAELNEIAKALAAFRRDRGSFVITDKERVLIDHLTPRYLSRVTRFDPWHRPYEYNGEGERFTLRSLGSDGKPNTSDDVVVSQP